MFMCVWVLVYVCEYLRLVLSVTSKKRAQTRRARVSVGTCAGTLAGARAQCLC